MATGWIPQKGEDGYPLISPTFEDDLGLNATWEGYKYTATAGVLNVWDEQVTTERKLRGGWYELLHDPSIAPEAALNDYLEFAIVDKDDTLGMFSALGFTVGVDVLELSKFVRKDFINPWATSRQLFQVSGKADVVTGLYFRTYYNSTGANAVNLKVVVNYHEV